MIAVALAFGIVGGIILLAWKGTTAELSEVMQRKKLASLGKKPVSTLKLDEAEDGLVLARRFKDAVLEKKFSAVVKAMRPKRATI